MSRSLMLSLSLLAAFACQGGKRERPRVGDPVAAAPRAKSPRRTVDRRQLVAEVERSKAIPKMRPSPHPRGRQAHGFKVYAIRRDSLWDRLGIKNGDTIMRINNIALTSPDDALRAYRAFKATRGGEEATLTLLRRGKQMTLSYRII